MAQDGGSAPNPWQQLYEMQHALSLAEDVEGMLRALGSTAAARASALVHVSIDPAARQSVLAYQIVGGIEMRPAQALAMSFDDLNQDSAAVGFATASDSDPSSLRPLAQQFSARSHAWIILRDQEETRDILLLIYEQRREFDAQQRRLIEAFAQQAQILAHKHRQLKQAHLHNQYLERQVSVLETLNLLANSVGGQSDEQAVMDAAMQNLVQAAGADHAAIALIEPDGQRAVVRSEYPAQGAVGAEFPVESNPIFNTLLRERYAPILVEDLNNDERITPAVYEVLNNFGIKSLIIAPLNVGGRLIGSLGVDLYSNERKFDPQIIDLVDALTNQLALYVQDSRARHERQQMEARTAAIDRIVNRFAALNRADDLIQEAARGLQEVFNAKRITIHLLDDDAPLRPQDKERAE
jgi:GAF domain-containing protein